ncbi:hypothetical protein RKD49_002129 [Streptomyces glaucescens]
MNPDPAPTAADPIQEQQMTTPAEEIRTAAQILRRLAAAATGGPWETTWRGQQYHLDGYRDGDLHPISEWTYAIATWEPQVHDERADCDTADADYIAAMHPGVGAALARWLESWTGVDLHEAGSLPEDAQHALAVARQITAAHPTKETP